MVIDLFTGHDVRMKVDHPMHYNEKARKTIEKDDVSTSFAEMLKSSLGKVNDLQVDSDEVTRKMIYEPESVDIHTVMIAAQKAELALTFTKSVRDEAIRAYRDLINMR